MSTDYSGLFVGFLLGLAGPLITDWIQRSLRSPRLSVDFLANDHCLRFTGLRFQEAEKLFSTNAKYLRILVSNHSRQSAKNVGLLLLGIRRKSDDGKWETVLHDTLPLNCALRGFEPVEVPPGAHLYFDVLWSKEGAHSFTPSTNAQPLSVSGQYGHRSIYRLDCMLTCDGTKPIAFAMFLDWKCDWDFVDVWMEK